MKGETALRQKIGRRKAMQTLFLTPKKYVCGTTWLKLEMLKPNPILTSHPNPPPSHTSRAPVLAMFTVGKKGPKGVRR